MTHKRKKRREEEAQPVQIPSPISFPSQQELQALTQQRFETVRQQQELDRQAAQAQAQEVFGEGALGRVEQGRSAEVANILALQGQQTTSGAAGLEAAAARRLRTIETGGQDPAFRQIEEAATRAQDIQTQTALRQLRGDLGAQGVRGGINIQRQLQTLGGGTLAQSQLQAQLAQARLGRVSEAEAAQEGLLGDIARQQAGSLQRQQQGLFAARSEEAGREQTNVQRALQERLGRISLVEAAGQRGVLERAAASQEVTAAAQLQAQLAQQNEANRIALTQAQQKPAKAQVIKTGKMLCTEICRQGLLDPRILKGDQLYAESISIETKIGYWVWARPLVKACQRSPLMTKLSTPIVKAWATEMAHRVGYHPTGSFLGRVLTWTFEPACNLLGRILLKLKIANREDA